MRDNFVFLLTFSEKNSDFDKDIPSYRIVFIDKLFHECNNKMVILGVFGGIKGKVKENGV